MVFEPVTDHRVRWRTASGDGLEHVVLQATDEGIEARSWLIAPAEDGGSALTYRLTCDKDWRVRGFSLRASTGKTVSLRADGKGRWWDGDGTLLSDLAGCIDIDFALTPLTNTLPIPASAGRPDGYGVRPCGRLYSGRQFHSETISPALQRERAGTVLSQRKPGRRFHRRSAGR
ncbi:hypothetical protein HDIA_3645 [Hartmannibacter diazotrophicus]|uniref:Uncharacterized protein n=1 Tax=Hartmannibacter diazotrophicus TaxID=1482074 RepID=A0A2C9DA96_9HYPH|nr:putative glycolipid-binding domain-containing protein [Hartmannibacter diazotrophicus]SON57186.1 hypothetical protein HDIA_3645 [Hartmannibacter diazotrophicus]